MIPAKNVFNTPFRLHESVCVVAPGINGRKFYGQIPHHFQVIVVSKAVLIDLPRMDIWMMTHATQPWFAEANQRFGGIRVFGEVAAREAASHLAGKDPVYYFPEPPAMLDPGQPPQIDGCIKFGATISGCAVQLAYHFGAKEILLCGIDMSGHVYFDNSVSIMDCHGQQWDAVSRFNPLIHFLGQEKGISIQSLSPTALDVPAWNSDQVSAVKKEVPCQTS